MKHRIQNLLAGMIAVVTGRWLAVALGASLRLQLLVSLGIAFMLLALAEWSLRLWLERIIAEAHPGELRDAAAAEPELQALLADRSRSNERRDWQWTVHSVTWAVLAVAASVTTTALAGGQRSAHAHHQRHDQDRQSGSHHDGPIDAASARRSTHVRSS